MAAGVARAAGGTPSGCRRSPSLPASAWRERQPAGVDGLAPILRCCTCGRGPASGPSKPARVALASLPGAGSPAVALAGAGWFQLPLRSSSVKRQPARASGGRLATAAAAAVAGRCDGAGASSKLSSSREQLGDRMGACMRLGLRRPPPPAGRASRASPSLQLIMQRPSLCCLPLIHSDGWMPRWCWQSEHTNPRLASAR